MSEKICSPFGYKDFHDFGKAMYELAMKNFYDQKGIEELEVPLSHPDHPTSIMTMRLSMPLQIIIREGLDSVSYFINSDGTLGKEVFRMKGFYNGQ